MSDRVGPYLADGLQIVSYGGVDVTFYSPPRPPGFKDCRVYWGTHGCELPRGHDGPHICACAHDSDLTDEVDEDGCRLYADGVANVGAPPYYGPKTNFYGEDAGG